MTTTSERRVPRLGGWGFDGEGFDPPAPMLDWLRRRLGATEPFPRIDRERSLAAVPEPIDVGELGPAEVSTDPLDRLRHARGQGTPDLMRLRSGTVRHLPDAIARPADDEELDTLLRAAADRGLRVIPWGGGTSVTGGVNLVPDERPAVVVDLERFSGLVDLDPVSGLATLGAGTRGPALEAALGEHGFTLGHFPQSFELSTLGGWIAAHSSGQESLGYGRIESLVAGLDAVSPAGRTHVPALPASAAGPDPRRYWTGSEGRFGVITRATVRVRRVPEATRVEAVLVSDWSTGLDAARDLVQGGVPLCLLRLSDRPETEVALSVGLAKSRFAPLMSGWLRLRGVGRGCLLLLGAHGSEAEVDLAFERARLVLRGRRHVWLGAGPGKHWRRDRFRHPYLRDALIDRGLATDTFETAAPWSRLDAVYRAVRDAFADAAGPDEREIPVLCHVSHPYLDGASLYFTFFFRCPQDGDAAVARWAELKRRAQAAVARAGGATSHHHGVGSWHAPWLADELGATGVAALGALARVHDPAGVLAPHVLLDPDDRLEV